MLSIVWIVVLFCCSLLLPWIGHLCDKHGPRQVLAAVIVPYVLLLAAMGKIINLGTFVGVFFPMRLIGPGVLVLIGFTTSQHWYKYLLYHTLPPSNQVLYSPTFLSHELFSFRKLSNLTLTPNPLTGTPTAPSHNYSNPVYTGMLHHHHFVLLYISNYYTHHD